MFAWDMQEIITTKTSLIPARLLYDSTSQLFKDNSGNKYVFNNLNNAFYKTTGVTQPTVGANASYDNITQLYNDNNKKWVFNQIAYKMYEVIPNSVIYTSDSILPPTLVATPTPTPTPAPTPTPTTGQIRIRVTLDGQPVDAKGIVLHMESPGLITQPSARDISAAGNVYQKPLGSNKLIFDGGTPIGTTFVNVTPSDIQTVTAGQETIWTLNFESIPLSLTPTPTPTPTPALAPAPTSISNTFMYLAVAAGVFLLLSKKHSSGA